MGELTDRELEEVRVDFTALYQAGNVDMPEKADDLASVASTMGTSITDVAGHLGSIGSPAVGGDTLDLMGACHEGVRSAVITLNNIARVLVEVGDDFRARDDDAKTMYQNLDDSLKQSPGPVTVPPPATEDDEYGTGTNGTGPSGPYLPGEVG